NFEQIPPQFCSFAFQFFDKWLVLIHLLYNWLMIHANIKVYVLWFSPRLLSQFLNLCILFLSAVFKLRFLLMNCFIFCKTLTIYTSIYSFFTPIILLLAHFKTPPLPSVSKSSLSIQILYPFLYSP